jgi:hypothetical protein
VDRVSRRFLIASALLSATLAVLAAFGLFPPTLPAPRNANPFVYTLDRGGIVRFNNGKADVESAFIFDLNAGLALLPSRIGRWDGTDFPLNLEAYAELQPEALVNRVYRNSLGESVYFTVIGSNTSRKLHRPEICYRAADWTLAELPVHPIALDSGQVAVGRILARSGTLNEERIIFYWYLWRDGNRRIEDGAYVMQVAASLNNQSMDQAVMAAEHFTRQILRRTVGDGAPALRLPFAT